MQLQRRKFIHQYHEGIGNISINDDFGVPELNDFNSDKILSEIMKMVEALVIKKELRNKTKHDEYI